MAAWNKKREVMHHYNSLASVYDGQYGEEQDAKMEVALSSTKLKKDSLVLDAGCGTGMLFKHVGRSVKLLVGLDVSPRILKEAKKRVKQLPTTAVVRADADFTPFQNDVFDATFAITLLQNVPDPLVTLREMKRVSKDRAFIVITGLKKKFSREAFVKLLQRTGLEVSVIESGGELKGHVAVCRKGRKHLKERFGSYKARTENANARSLIKSGKSQITDSKNRSHPKKKSNPYSAVSTKLRKKSNSSTGCWAKRPGSSEKAETAAVVSRF